MDIKCKLIKELDNGGAIVSIDMDEEAKDFLISEGFIKVLGESLKNSKTYISEADVKRIVAKKMPKIQSAPTKSNFTKEQIRSAIKKAKNPKAGKIVPKKGKAK